MVHTYQQLELLPHPVDNKQWIAEITGPHDTYRLKRQFLPAEEGCYRIYDGWYQIHGTFLGAQTPFTKEYCFVYEGKMTRHRTFQQTLLDLPLINVMEEQRIQRLKAYIETLLEDIYHQVSHEMVQEDLVEHKDQLSLIQNSQELYEALRQLIQRKPFIIKHYKNAIKNEKKY